MTSPTTHKGNIGQTAVTLEALKRGYHVSVPLEGAAYDLVIDKGGVLHRVQVKYKESRNGVLPIAWRLYSTEIDVIVAHDGKTGKSYWLPTELVRSSRSIALRTEPTKNNQETGIEWADMYANW